MIRVLDKTKDNVVAVQVEEKLEPRDYRKLNKLVDNVMFKGEKPVHMYIEMGEIEGIRPSVLWKDVQFEFRHYNDFSKIAIVGDQRWEKWMGRMYERFTSADVQFFETTRKKEATHWLKKNRRNLLEESIVIW